jgi:NifU-like protein involved in Fe-S cluster formation
MTDLGSPLPNVFGYPTPVWRRFRDPSHAGVLDGAIPGAVRARAASPASRGQIDLGLRLEPPGKIVEARFQAYGCPTTIAVGQWLAEQAQGREVIQLGEITAADIRAALEIGEDRAHCAVLGEDVIRSLMQQVRTS